jgi:hypothetical protein
MFSCFALPDSFLAGMEGVGFCFNVLCSRTHFGRYRGHRFQFSFFGLPDRFGRYRGRWVPFQCFALPDSFWAVPRASSLIFMFWDVPRAPSPILMFCAVRLIFGCTESLGPFFIFCARTHFRQYRVRRVQFSCFVLSGPFWAVPRTSSPIFMFCATRLFFDGTEGVRSRFNALRSRIHFGRYRGRQVQFSCFGFPDQIWAIPRALGQVFMFCAPRLVFSGTVGARSSFIFCAPLLVFSGTENTGSYFNVMRSRTHFGRYRGRQVQFSCFVLPDSFWDVPRASGPIFIFCATRLIFGDTEGLGSRFHVLCSRTHFRRYRGSRVMFLWFSLVGLLWAIARASGPVFMFCALGLIFSGIEGVGSRFNVLRSRTHFGRYQGRRVQFSCFELPDPFWAVPRASGPILMFCAPRLIFYGTEGLRTCFHVLHS